MTDPKDKSAPVPLAAAKAAKDPGRRVNWSEVLRDHNISPDAVSADPVAQPDPWARSRPSASPTTEADAPAAARPARPRGLQIVGWLAALFSLTASAAVLWVLVRGRFSDQSPGQQPTYDSQSALAFYRSQLPAYTGPVAKPEGSTDADLADRITQAEASPSAGTQATGMVAVADTAASPGKPTSGVRPNSSTTTDKRPIQDNTKQVPADKPVSDKPAEDLPAPKSSDSPALTDRPAPPVNLPPVPVDADVNKALLSVRSALLTCATDADMSGQIALKIQITEKGSVAWAAARPTAPPFHQCMERVMRTVRLPATRNGGLVRHTLTVP